MTVPMAEVPLHERPRERLVARGPGALTERELLAILLRTGARGVNAVDLAGAMLAEYGGLRSLASARPEELAARAKAGCPVSKLLKAEITLDAVLDGGITMEDLRIAPEALRSQAEISRSAGRHA